MPKYLDIYTDGVKNRIWDLCGDMALSAPVLGPVSSKSKRFQIITLGHIKITLLMHNINRNETPAVYVNVPCSFLSTSHIDCLLNVKDFCFLHTTGSVGSS